MSIRLLPTRIVFSSARVFFMLFVFGGLLTLPISSQAQQRVSKRYPAGKNVRVDLKNISGTIAVESWNRDEIKISASFESPKANMTPRLVGDCLDIDVIGENRGRGEVGDVNFKIQVPLNSSVDIETKRGDIRIANIRADSVRAHVTSEGDIELTGVNATQVFAQNNIGNIFFDGEFSRGGKYHFQSMKGDISIRIPADSVFKLTATASTRKIALGDFWNKDFKNVGDGRKFVGDVGGFPSSVISVTTFQGSITFLRK